ncbi:GlxA family transcriptional regulator [Chachezhania sediminis]|uniref:GlxA family transcriptional regulator n=1 Tax=Chachezhania sediminis TaxID=2599291 RepID=UPI00131EB1A2|nr:helix-turn-helix domain-containing protein [Chachezhania sediminis]
MQHRTDREAGASGKPSQRAPGKTRIAIVLPPNALVSAVCGAYDILSSAGMIWSTLRYGVSRDPIFDISVVAPRAGPAECLWDIQIFAHKALSEATDSDIVVIPTFEASTVSRPRPELDHPDMLEIMDWLKGIHDRGGMLCSISTGSLLLAEMGLLDGEEATTHWAYAQAVEAWYPKVKFNYERAVYRVGPDRRIWVAGGGTCWQDLVVQLIARAAGPLVAAQTARSFTIFGQRGGQLPFTEFQPRLDHGDAAILRAQTWIDEQHAAPDAISGAREASGLTDRTFKRRFKSATGLPPTVYLQKTRVIEARMLLESTNLRIDEVAEAVGYGDAAFFRNLFKKVLGLHPSEYRDQFSLLGAEPEDRLPGGRAQRR